MVSSFWRKDLTWEQLQAMPQRDRSRCLMSLANHYWQLELKRIDRAYEHHLACAVAVREPSATIGVGEV